MPAQGPGARSTRIASKAVKHGQIVFEDGIVGSAFKVDQPDRFVRPVDMADIALNEEYEIEVGGLQWTPATGPLAAVDTGDKVYIATATNALRIGTAAGAVPVGVVERIFQKGGVAFAEINTSAWHAFLPGV